MSICAEKCGSLVVFLFEAMLYLLFVCTAVTVEACGSQAALHRNCAQDYVSKKFTALRRDSYRTDSPERL